MPPYRCRRAVPPVPCALSPCAPRAHTLWPCDDLIGDAACAEEPLTSQLTAEALAPRASRAPLGWAPSPNTSLWWWEPRRRQQRAERAGCCQPIPLFGPCIDPAGARRPLGHEPLLATADLAQFLAEASTSAARHAPAEVATAHLPANWTDAAFNDLRDPMASHRVLVLDAAGVDYELVAGPGETSDVARFLTEGPSYVGCVADTDTKVMVWRVQEAAEFWDRHPEIGYRIVTSMAKLLYRRLQQLNQIILDRVSWGLE